MNMSRKKFLLLACFVVLIAGLVFLVLRSNLIFVSQHEPKPIAYKELDFVRNEGFLLQEGFSVIYYSNAAKQLKGHEDIFKTLELFKEDKTLTVPLSHDIINTVRIGAQKKQSGIKDPKFFEESFLVNSQIVLFDDIYLCAKYLGYLLRSNKASVISEHVPDLPYMCFAMGIQLSQCDNDVLKAYGLACKHEAIKWLVEYHQKNESPEKTQELKALSENINKQMQSFREELRRN